MGRQAYTTRLALGRSPFHPPSLTDSGDFILGAHAHEFDNPDGYTQQYDESGHPEFRASRTAAKDLRRAKNDVLSTVGVVYKEARPLSSDKQGIESMRRMREECKAGYLLSCMDSMLMFCSLWRLFSLRAKVQAFELASPPLLQIIKFELHELGPLRFLFAGLPFCLIPAVVLSGWRKFWTLDRVEWWLSDFSSRRIFDMVFFILFSSVEAFETLPWLRLMPVGQHFALQPRHASSPERNPFSGSTRHPIYLLWILRTLNQQLQPVLWRAIWGAVPTPCKKNSINFPFLPVDENSQSAHPGLHKLPSLLIGEARLQSSKIGSWLRANFERVFTRFESAQDSTSAPQKTTDGGDDADHASTATPDPEDLFLSGDFIEQYELSERSAEPDSNPPSHTNTLFTPQNRSPATTATASPLLHASLIHRDSRTTMLQLELRESSSQLINGELPHGQPVNLSDRPTEELLETAMDTADVETPISEPDRESHHQQGQIDGATDDDDDSAFGTSNPRLKVTSLSVFAADTFAWHAASLLTTAALIPLERVFIRSLVTTAPFVINMVNHRPSSSSSSSPPLLSSNYHNNLFALLGLQAVVSSTIWGIGTAVAIGLGRARYRWGGGGGQQYQAVTSHTT